MNYNIIRCYLETRVIDRKRYHRLYREERGVSVDGPHKDEINNDFCVIIVARQYEIIGDSLGALPSRVRTLCLE